ncbi:stress responsive A/B barrel domain-containing protein [Xylariaceae sp. FL1019]|nr:stress responsive A/B barrel domain-containing protein [Xylariaceae sp. FL1019]
MPVNHLVLLQLKADVAAETVNQVCNQLLSLKDTCLHPESQKPYIRSLTGGKDNSPEGLQNGIQYAFVVEFENEADRDYYVKTDPSHRSFVATNGPHLEKVIVVDYNF